MIDKYTAPEVQEALNLVVPCTWITAPCTVIRTSNHTHKKYSYKIIIMFLKTTSNKEKMWL